MRIVIPLWCALLTAVSLAPGDLKADLGTKGAFHFPAHFLVFVITGIIFCWTANSLSSRLARALGACCVAVLLEALEAWPLHHRIEWHDVWAGWLGVAAGCAIIAVFQGTKTIAFFVRK